MPLRALGTGSDLVDLVVAYLRGRYQIEASREALETLWHSSRALLLLDGLDELASPHEKSRLLSQIKETRDRFPHLRMILTTREPGIETRLLAPLGLPTFFLAPWGEEQVSSLARQFFESQSAEGVAEEVAIRFAAEAQHVPDVPSSPLLLTQLMAIYSDTGRLASSDVDIYEQVVLRSWDRWDRQRGLSFSPESAALVVPILERLADAMWESSRDGEWAQLGGSEVSRVVAQYLEQHTGDASPEVVSDFLDTLTVRSGLFVQTGLSRSGEAMFGFVHRGVLEYLLARSVVARFDVQGVSDWILKNFGHAPNSRVIRFVFGVVRRNRLNGAGDLVDRLISRAEQVGAREFWLIVTEAVAENEISWEMNRELQRRSA